jgi:hypothetical protein
MYLARGGPRRLVINEDWSRCRKHKNTQIDFHKTQISKIDVFFVVSFTALYGPKIKEISILSLIRF